VAEKRRQRGPKRAHGSRQEGDRNPAAHQCGHARLPRRWCQSRLNTLQQSSAIRPISSSPGFGSLKILSTNDAARGDMARRYWHVRFVPLADVRTAADTAIRSPRRPVRGASASTRPRSYRPPASRASRSISSPAHIRSGRADATPPPPEWLRVACSSPRAPCSPRASSPRTGTSGGSCARRCARSPCP
jgi:hypothetical protein